MSIEEKYSKWQSYRSDDFYKLVREKYDYGVICHYFDGEDLNFLFELISSGIEYFEAINIVLHYGKTKDINNQKLRQLYKKRSLFYTQQKKKALSKLRKDLDVVRFSCTYDNNQRLFHEYNAIEQFSNNSGKDIRSIIDIDLFGEDVAKLLCYDTEHYNAALEALRTAKEHSDSLEHFKKTS